MTIDDIVSTLEFNKMLRKRVDGEGYEIIMEQEEEEHQHRLYAKSELLTWVPYMVAAKGDAGILNIPRQMASDKTIASSDISMDAIIPSSSRRRRRKSTTQSPETLFDSK